MKLTRDEKIDMAVRQALRPLRSGGIGRHWIEDVTNRPHAKEWAMSSVLRAWRRHCAWRDQQGALRAEELQRLEASTASIVQLQLWASQILEDVEHMLEGGRSERERAAWQIQRAAAIARAIQSQRRYYRLRWRPGRTPINLLTGEPRQ